MKKILFAVALIAFSFLPSSIATAAPNLIQNPSTETGSNIPDFWLPGQWGTNTATFTYPVAGFESEHAVHIDMSDHTDGDAKWYFTDVVVKPATTYVFSNRYVSDVATNYTIQYTSTTGELSYISLGDVPAAEVPTESQFTFTTPADADSLTIFHLIEEVGFLTTGDYSLVETGADMDSDDTPRNRGMVTLAMDDGFKSTFTNALPILDSYGLKSSQYINSGSLGEAGYMTVQDVRTMQSAGHEIGGHTKTHAHLTELSESDIENEVISDRVDLLALGATPVLTFTYPYGEFNELVTQIVRDAGFIGARSVNTGFNTSASDPYALLDQHVENDVSVGQIKEWIDTAISDDTWLIMEFHRQEADCTDNVYCNTIETFAAIADYLVEQDVRVVTLAEGIAIMNQ